MRKSLVEYEDKVEDFYESVELMNAIYDGDNPFDEDDDEDEKEEEEPLGS